MAKIMLVEDDNNLREIYGARLQAEGHEIVAAKDGEEALALAVKEKPELIISDVMMPRISGFDMLDILRNAPETKDTKVIMMTALSQAEDKARADKLGADRYLVKSQVTLEDVAHVVRDVLEGKPESSGASSATDAGQPAPLPVNDVPQPEAAVPSAAPPEPAPSVEAIANPVVEVHDEPNPSQIQAPPAEEPQPESPTETTAPATEPSTPTAAPAAASPAADDAATDDTSTDDLAVNASSAAADEDMVTKDPVPAPPAAEPAPLKVELPQTSSEPTVETPASTQNNSTEDSKDSTFVGPTLAEALASEESTPSQSEKSEAAPTPSPSPPPETASPTAANDPDKSSENDTGVTSGSSASAAAGMRVIQPINDPTAKPDINKLLDDEERKAAIENPTANTLITPEKKDGNDSVNNIAL